MEKLPSLKNWNLSYNNVVIGQDNHAEFINSHYKKLLPIEGLNTLKFSITNAIVEYAAVQSNFHIILSNCNLNKSGRTNVLSYFHEKGFTSIIVYFNLSIELLKTRVEQTQRSKAIFRSASSLLEVLERQGNSGEIPPSEMGFVKKGAPRYDGYVHNTIKEALLL
ncbi:hypothetical protein ASG89_18345 [Paenibacillus sp. Soil766]|uniref:AAA family ATPase n=1 Tax=Paenibacillus sp. Soil766 TaxID=1736404 RepID=UPI00070F9FDC|nr:AAA family ATPase [Paenibacillus sp. Soil766]KRF06812.1 hypothetical protein ASG89_18345 [Paenibacillus sp. Soil766]